MLKKIFSVKHLAILLFFLHFLLGGAAHSQGYKCVAEHTIGYQFNKKTGTVESFNTKRSKTGIDSYILKPSALGVSGREPWVFTNHKKQPSIWCDRDFTDTDLLICAGSHQHLLFNRVTGLYIIYDAGGLTSLELELDQKDLEAEKSEKALKQRLARMISTHLTYGKCTVY